MSYNKRAHLQTNIEAVRIAFTLDREKRRATEAEQAVLRQYSGFGGLKCILNPAQAESDRAYWTKSESDLFPTVSELHGLIRENLEEIDAALKAVREGKWDEFEKTHPLCVILCSSTLFSIIGRRNACKPPEIFPEKRL
ncbi:MAG: hypothetical protein LBK96_00395 [Prevotellaceae bacterium]|jgi:hypothetical protein|nr:hypothetical protein [Prevotellaceae bacterium]